jgi:hypothetical protein
MTRNAPRFNVIRRPETFGLVRSKPVETTSKPRPVRNRTTDPAGRMESGIGLG